MELAAAWAQQSSLMASRHIYEGLAARLELAATLATMGRDDVALLRDELLSQV